MFLLDGISTFCSGTAGLWAVLGWFVVILKIVIPLILIILGMVDLGKAVISSDEKEINNAINFLLRRFIAAVAIFFVPTIVSALFNAILGVDLNKPNANLCVQCVTDIQGHQNECKSDVGIETRDN